MVRAARGSRRQGAARGGKGHLAPLLQEVEEASVPTLEWPQQPLSSELATHLGVWGVAASGALGCSVGLQRGVARKHAAHVA